MEAEENKLSMNRCFFREREANGLIIEEAYLGRYDHILHIDSGLLEWKEPTSFSEYETCQVIPIKNQLQMLVKNSKLTIIH